MPPALRRRKGAIRRTELENAFSETTPAMKMMAHAEKHFGPIRHDGRKPLAINQFGDLQAFNVRSPCRLQAERGASPWLDRVGVAGANQPG
jgi:hypothetical protein